MNSSVKILKGVPMPNKARWPLHEMEIGDSFQFKQADYNSISAFRTVYQNNNPGTRFTIRRLDDDLFGLWRTK